MTEKKTFKNPRDMAVYNDGSIYVKDTNSAFNYREWDMEVTFTKKVRAPKVGDRALSPSGASVCEIAAIDGDEVWLRYSDGSHSTIDVDRLIYAS